MAIIKNITAEEALKDPTLWEEIKKDYISIDEASALYRVSYKTLYNLKTRNELLSVKKYMKKLYFKKDELDMIFQII